MVYSVVQTYLGVEGAAVVRRDADGALVPIDADTADSRAFRDWLAAGNAPTPLPKPTLAEAKITKLAALADRRWRAEMAGTIVNGMGFPTDEKTQAKLTAAVVASVLDNNYAVTWKLADASFVMLDHAALIAVAQSVRAHVQESFEREAQLAAAICAADDVETLDAIDIESGWPE